MASQTIVILGAGFGGMAAAQELSKLLPSSKTCDIVLIDEHNYSLFTPMLTEVAGSTVDPDQIVVAVRSLDPRVTFVQGRVTHIDPGGPSVTVTIGNEQQGVPETQQTIRADHLVVALGSVTNFHHIPGVAENALTVKSVQDAAAIRDRALALLERADAERDTGRRRALLTFVVGGGGFSGVETMAALNDMVRDLVARYPHISANDVRTVIAQPGDRLLPELSESLASYTQRKLQARGVEVRLNTEVSGASADSVELKPSKGGQTERVETHTLIWAGGVKPNPVVEGAGFQLGHHHGIVVDGCCRVQDHPAIWALGDCAEVPKPGGKGTYAPTAQNATREGAQVARNIAAVLQGGSPEPFVYTPIGELAIVGKHSGVASLYGLRFSGIVAWAMWRAIYLGKLPSALKRIQVGVNWLMDLAFGRDTVNTGVTAGTGGNTQETHGKDRHEKESKPKAAARA